MALLAGAQDFVRMGQLSNYATWAEGWRGLPGNYSFAFPGRGGVALLNRRGKVGPRARGKVVCSEWIRKVARRGTARLLNGSLGRAEQAPPLAEAPEVDRGGVPTVKKRAPM